MNVYSIRARATRNHPGGAVASVTLMHAQDRLISFISLPLERYVHESGGAQSCATDTKIVPGRAFRDCPEVLHKRRNPTPQLTELILLNLPLPPLFSSQKKKNYSPCLTLNDDVVDDDDHTMILRTKKKRKKNLINVI